MTSPSERPALADGLTAVVPVYRSAAILPELHERLSKALAAVTEHYEIVLVEDAGGDESWSVIEGLAAADPHVREFRMSRNYGQHNALLCGIREARYDLIATLDDDLQNPPEEISRLVERLGDDVDVVYGSPETEQHGFLRNQASRITKLALQSAMGAECATRQHVSCIPNTASRRVRVLPRSVRLDRCVADVGDHPVRTCSRAP